MKETIAKLRAEQEHHLAEADNRQKAIKALQAVCQHKWEDDGHDSHNRYQRCRVCGLRR